MTETKFRILVADDDEMIRELHAEFVRGFGYEVEVAADGIEAIAKIGLGVDLVLTDAHMPNLDGFDVARRIRQTKSSEELPIVMATSLEAREDRLRAYEVGINDFINKPVDHTELRLRLKWLLELKSAHDKLRASKRNLEDTVQLRTKELRHALEEVTQAQRPRTRKPPVATRRRPSRRVSKTPRPASSFATAAARMPSRASRR
jgi:putative two-component system response regulator